MRLEDYIFKQLYKSLSWHVFDTQLGAAHLVGYQLTYTNLIYTKFVV